MHSVYQCSLLYHHDISRFKGPLVVYRCFLYEVLTDFTIYFTSQFSYTSEISTVIGDKTWQGAQSWPY